MLVTNTHIKAITIFNTSGFKYDNNLRIEDFVSFGFPLACIPLGPLPGPPGLATGFFASGLIFHPPFPFVNNIFLYMFRSFSIILYAYLDLLFLLLP